MNIIFRVDSSTDIGIGHMMRCLTLAGNLKKQYTQLRILFISRDLDGNINNIVEKNGYGLCLLPREHKKYKLQDYEKWLSVPKGMDVVQTIKFLEGEEISLLVVDNYALDYKWENIVRPFVKAILVIDDLANRIHECDFLLDQTYGNNVGHRYDGLVPKKCKLFLGIEYVLLRDGFYRQRKLCQVRRQIQRILVFYGGSDDTHETIKVLKGLQKLKQSSYKIDVVVGSSNIQKKQIEQMCKRLKKVTYYCQVNNMEDFIANADIALGASGGNTWERCALGLPAVVTITAGNQKEIALQVEKTGAIKVIGCSYDLSEKEYYHILLQLDKLPLEYMSRQAFALLGKSKLEEAIHKMLG